MGFHGGAFHESLETGNCTSNRIGLPGSCSAWGPGGLRRRAGGKSLRGLSSREGSASVGWEKQTVWGAVKGAGQGGAADPLAVSKGGAIELAGT